MAITHDRTWTELYESYGDHSPQGLARILAMALANDSWATDAFETGLYEFLGLCWPHDPLRAMINSAIQYWPKERRADLVRCITPYIPDAGGYQLIVETLDQIKVEPVDWLWEPYIPCGEITFLEGSPGEGKTWLALALAAAVAEGWELPNQQGFVPPPSEPIGESVLYISHEDSPGRTIKPRICSLALSDDAQLTIGVLRGVRQGSESKVFNFGLLDILEAYVAENRVKLVVIDPITDYLGSTDIYRQNEVADILSPLHAMAGRQNCAVLAIRHWVKAIGHSASMRGMGSVGFIQKARSALVVASHPDDSDLRIMAHAKHNLSYPGVSQSFSLEGGRFAWCGVSDLTANELAFAKPKVRPNGQRRLDDVSNWLKNHALADGEVEYNSLLMLGGAVGYSESEIKKSLHHSGLFESFRASDRTVFWSLKNRSEVAYPYE